jgi:hypothetical protein
MTYRALAPEVAGAGGEPPGARAGARETYYQFVFADPVPGRESEYNAWYDRHHGPDVASVPGFVSWQRAVLNPQQLNPAAATAQYLALFKIETSDLTAVFQTFRSRAPHMSMSPAFDDAHTFGYTYKAIGPLLSGDRIRSQRARDGHT